MSDNNLTPPPPEAPPVQPTPYGSAVPSAKKALSLTSFVLGIASVVLFILNWVAVAIGIAAVVLGFIGRSRESGAPRWMWLTGIITGVAGIVFGAVVLLVIIAAAAYLRSNGGY